MALVEPLLMELKGSAYVQGKDEGSAIYQMEDPNWKMDLHSKMCVAHQRVQLFLVVIWSR